MSSKVEVFCPECGTGKMVFPSTIKAGRKYGFFCNKDCLGRFRSKKLTGSLAANWNGGTTRDRSYVMVFCPWHQNNKNGFVYLHRLVMEIKLNRFLTRKEIVHHKDNNPENNHWDNLELMSQSDHARDHAINSRKRHKTTGRFL